MKVTLRPATEADYEFARTAHHAAYRDVIIRQFGTFEELEQDAFFTQSWNKATYQIIEFAGTPAGYCSINRSPANIFIETLAIIPEFQGKGIGTHILKDVLEEAAQAHLPTRLQVFKKNNAIELYKRLGFEIVEEQNIRFVMECKP